MNKEQYEARRSEIYNQLAQLKDEYIRENTSIEPGSYVKVEWGLYDTWYRRLWWNTKNALRWIFRYHQPQKLPMNLKHVGRQKKVPGHTLFAYNRVTGTCFPAPVVNGGVLMEQDCIYRQALNMKNFKKRLRREEII